MRRNASLISQNLGWRCSVQNYVKCLFIKRHQCSFQAAVATVLCLKQPPLKWWWEVRVENRFVCPFVWLRVMCVCVLYSLSKLMEQRRKTAYSRTRHSPSLRSNLQQFRWTHSTCGERECVISCCTARNKISDFSESENSVRALRPWQEEDQMKIIGEEKLLLMFAHVFIH